MNLKRLFGMNLLKRYRVVIPVVLPIFILVLFRSIGPYHFKTDAKKQAEPSFLKTNIVSIGQTDYMPGNKLIINLDKGSGILDGTRNSVMGIPADSVLKKEYFRIIRNHEGPVLLYSSEPGTAARIWMVLSQMGCENIFILTNDPGNENPKHPPQ